MQAFLRDELLAFCREAPPEFNEHQRDVFCVFSGTGVARLRDFLNERKAHAAAAAAAGSQASSIVDDSDQMEGDIDDNNPESDGSNTPVVNVNVHGNYPHGHTPIIPGPSSAVGFQGFVPVTHGHGSGGPPSNLSQSAPATTGGAVWAGGNTPVVLQHGTGAQHVTGMMGATILDEVEGDEAFGEGSEIMGD